MFIIYWYELGWRTERRAYRHDALDNKIVDALVKDGLLDGMTVFMVPGTVDVMED